MEYLSSVVIPILIAVVLVVLVWLLVELVMTLRKARVAVVNANELVEKTNVLVDEVKTQIEPTLARIDPMVEQLEPAVGRVDPLMERVQLTIDAANLEIMRLDQILDDVSQVTGVAGKAAQSVDTVTSAPAELVTGAVEKLRVTAKGSARKAAAKRALEGEDAAALPGRPQEKPAAHKEREEAAEPHRAAKQTKTTIQAGTVAEKPKDAEPEQPATAQGE